MQAYRATDTERIRQGLSGPIPSIRTPFRRDGAIDYKSLKQMVDFNIEAGAGALLITAGDTLFALLSDKEIGELTQAVVEYARGRAVVVGCTGYWGTPQAVVFAQFCRQIGVDILQAFLPHWYPRCLDLETIVQHHLALAQHIPVMANSAMLHVNGAAEGLAAARRLLECSANVLAMKADVGGAYDRAMTTLTTQQWAVFAGGKKEFHMELWPYGCQGYLSTHITFRPSVTDAYWAAIRNDDMAAAVLLIERLDRPFFEQILAMPGGFDAALHGILELCGLAERWRRPPFTSLSDSDMERMSDCLASLAATERNLAGGAE